MNGGFAWDLDRNAFYSYDIMDALSELIADRKIPPRTRVLPRWPKRRLPRSIVLSELAQSRHRPQWDSIIGPYRCRGGSSRQWLTNRMCARLQGFLDGWQFVGVDRLQAKQIGNAVPPRLRRSGLH